MLKKFALLWVFIFGFFTSCFPPPAHIQPTINKCNSPNNLPTENSPNVVTNIVGIPILWEHHFFPIQVAVDPLMRDRQKNVVKQAISVWNSTTGLSVFTYIEGNNKKNSDNETSNNGVIWINEEVLEKNECGNQLYGLAQRFYKRNLSGIRMFIVGGKIRLHNNIPPDRELNTAIHELGHILGFQHDSEISSVMYPYILKNQKSCISNEDKEHVVGMILNLSPKPILILDLIL